MRGVREGYSSSSPSETRPSEIGSAPFTASSTVVTFMVSPSPSAATSGTTVRGAGTTGAGTASGAAGAGAGTASAFCVSAKSFSPASTTSHRQSSGSRTGPDAD